MRIVSLLPAATEWVFAFGAGDDLVGRSHACTYPASAGRLPVLTAPAFAGGDSAEIDRAVRDQIQQGLSLYRVDLERLRALAPDLILTQTQCEVCAVSLPELERVLAAWMEARPEVLSLAPMTFKEVLDGALRIGHAIGRLESAMHLIAGAERDLRALHEQLGLGGRTPRGDRPAVACIEWLEPLMTAGHWMPDVVDLAGGRVVLSERGAPSRYVDWEDLRAADPDVLLVMPCGLSLEETRAELAYLTERPGWSSMGAVREGRVYLFDGDAYFNRPGPRLYRSVTLAAAALHPDRLAPEALSVDPWEMTALRGPR